MSRTDELRKGGARERGGTGGGAPFVKWGDSYAWIEGKMIGSFQTKYGLAVTLKVTAVCDDGLILQGKDEEGNEYTDTVTVGSEVNVGTQSAALAGKVTEDDKGKAFHIAFEGWEHPKGGNRYRLFSVIELTDRGAPAKPYEHEREVGSTTGEAGPGHPDSDIPF